MFRVTFYPNIDSVNDAEFTFENPKLSIVLDVKNAIADYTLMLHDERLMKDYSNMAVIEHFEDGEWVELDDDKDEIIDFLAEEQS